MSNQQAQKLISIAGDLADGRLRYEEAINQAASQLNLSKESAERNVNLALNVIEAS